MSSSKKRSSNKEFRGGHPVKTPFIFPPGRVGIPAAVCAAVALLRYLLSGLASPSAAGTCALRCARRASSAFRRSAGAALMQSTTAGTAGAMLCDTGTASGHRSQARPGLAVTISRRCALRCYMATACLPCVRSDTARALRVRQCDFAIEYLVAYRHGVVTTVMCVLCVPVWDRCAGLNLYNIATMCHVQKTAYFRILGPA